MKNDISNLIKETRVWGKKLGLTQEEISREIGVHPTTLRRWEIKEVDPSYSNFLKVEDFYNKIKSKILNLL
jgi:transcriptional regulator with XRE-family HTH domain